MKNENFRLKLLGIFLGILAIVTIVGYLLYLLTAYLTPGPWILFVNIILVLWVASGILILGAIALMGILFSRRRKRDQ